MFEIFFPITGMWLDPLLVLATGLLGGFISGFFGVGCGIIITPMLVELGIPPLISVATQLCHAVGTNTTNFLTYRKKMDVDYHLAAYLLIGGLLGTVTEWMMLKALPDSKAIFNKFIYVYITILITFGFVMIFQGYKAWKKRDTAARRTGVSMRRWMLYLPFHKIFVRSRAEMSILVPIFVGYLAGLLVASLGGGNNLFMAPILTYLIGRISPMVYGTTALVGGVITAVIALIYSTSGYCCDILFVVLLFAGAAFGSWIGVKWTYKFSRVYTYVVAAFIVFMMAGRQIFKLFNHSFAENVALKADLNQSFLAGLVDYDPVRYTILCIVCVILGGIGYLKIFERLSEKQKKRGRR